MSFSVFRPQVPPNARSMPPRIPPPSHRHASPSGPWPWMDLESEVDPVQLASSQLPHMSGEDGCWSNYPQSLFPNWNPQQVRRSGIEKVVKFRSELDCAIHHVDVGHDGKFWDPGRHSISEENKEESWKVMQRDHPEHRRVRALFVENLSGPVLQMLGTKYNIEPFFFSSSLNWIPSRYQEDIRLAHGDHITITLTFIRTMQNPMTVPSSPVSSKSAPTTSVPLVVHPVIDTQAPLALRSIDRILLPDLLAIHMIRAPDTSTIISYHPTPEWRTTTAKHLHSRVRFAGQSVFWQNIFQRSNDPTFVLLTLFWYALYAWDEALETLYAHICWLESRAITTNDMHITQELHIIRASLLYYASLLEDFRKSVVFILSTPNPAMDSPSYTDTDRDISKDLMKKECNNLISEIERLEMNRKMQDMRLENVMNLVFSSVNLNDSKYMQKLTEAAVRDSAAMKQISYLTMVFLPSSFIASVFGMNVRELAPGTLGTLSHYAEAAIPLTAATIWIIMAFHSKVHIDDPEATMWTRLWWPVDLVNRVFGRRENITSIV